MIMKSNELRIGNLYSENGIAKTVMPIDIQNLLRCEKHGIESDMKPIVLTEEWLLKFSFKHRIDRDIVAYEKKNLIVEYLFDRWTARLYETHLTSIQIIELKFVHQLQNIYFALTSEELILKS